MVHISCLHHIFNYAAIKLCIKCETANSTTCKVRNKMRRHFYSWHRVSITKGDVRQDSFC